MGVPEEVNAGLSARARKSLQPLYNGPGIGRLAWQPQLGLEGVMKLSEDEVNCFRVACLRKETIQPVQLLTDPIRPVGVESNNSDIRAIQMPPVLKVSSASVGGEAQL